MALLLDTALGTAISELFRLVVTVEKRRGDFKGNFETLKNTFESAILTLNDTAKLKIVCDRAEENTYEFINQLSHGVNLVKKCIEILYWKRYKYSKKLAELDECIEKFFNAGLQGSVAVNTLRNGVGIQEINDKFDFMFKYEPEIHVKKHHELLQSASCGTSLREFSCWESFQDPWDEFEMLHVDDEFEMIQDSSNEFSDWVTVPSLPNGVVGIDKDPFEVILESLQDPEIQTLGAGISKLLKVLVAVAKLTQNFQSNMRNLTKTLPENSLELKDMNTHRNLVEPSIRNLPDVVCTRGKHVGLKMEEACQIRKRPPGVVIKEPSQEIILSQASKWEGTSIGGGKGKEKLVCKPRKKAYKPKGVHLILN